MHTPWKPSTELISMRSSWGRGRSSRNSVTCGMQMAHHFVFCRPVANMSQLRQSNDHYVLQEVWQHAPPCRAPPAQPHLRIVGRNDANVGGLDASLHQGFCMRDDCLHARWFRFAVLRVPRKRREQTLRRRIEH